MYIELPDCRRCCFCVPLRHGILIFGYLNLFFSIFALSMELWMDLLQPSSTHTMFLYRGVGMYTQLWFPYLIYSLEIIFNVGLLVGAHKKYIRLIRLYYYYGIVTSLAAFLTLIVVRDYSQFHDWLFDAFEVCLAFSGLVLQCYLLLLIRTELHKLRYQGGQFRYVNHLAEVVVDPPRLTEGNSL